MSSVCVLWNTPLINQEITTLDFPKMRNLVTDKMVQSVATKHTEVDTLCLEHCKRLTDVSICSLAEHYAKELTYVNISYCPLLTDKAIKGLEKCRNLKTLIIIGCNGVSTKAVRNLSSALRHVQLYPPL
uniref:Uncharacterized protein n=1 Tax=Lotharella oceanica TaxID=641309 RepID=A0A7S2TPZ1_9EUKA|mmetsp:Transcript_24555/g.45913  ORF Transcript_24555/g.45913 Transcript_24555/m.45913 type:complete len:129 (+) Transcript_24555:73-459(+)